MSGRTILFLQVTEPGAYPPIMNAAFCLADRGWQATLLAAPIAGLDTPVPVHPGVTVRAIATRPSHVIRPADYLRYHLAAARLALTQRPAVIYASDPSRRRRRASRRGSREPPSSITSTIRRPPARCGRGSRRGGRAWRGAPRRSCCRTRRGRRW